MFYARVHSNIRLDANIKRKAVSIILKELRDRISLGLLNLSEQIGGNNNQRKAVSVTPQSKFAVAWASLSKLVGITRADTFYRCQYDLKEIKAAADTDSYLRLVIKKYSELFVKAGYVFKGENDEAAKYLESRFRIMSYMTGESFDVLLKETGYDLMKFSNAYWVKSRDDKLPFVKANGITDNGKVVTGYYRVDPDTMLIQFDKLGHVKGYKQVTESGREKKFKKEDVIHFTFDREAGSFWGTPRWIAVLEDIRALRKVEANVLALMYRYSFPMMHVKVGLEQAGMQGTRKEVDETRQVIENMPQDGMLVTTERVNASCMGVEGSVIDTSPTLTHFENRVFTGLNASQAMMGRGGAKQDADSMEEQIHNAVKDSQSTFAHQFRQEVITELLLEGGFNPILNEEDIVNLCFNEINLDTKIKTENHIVNKFQSNAITFTEMRNELGLRSSDVDEMDLYANKIEQTNQLEQIDANHENAMELARLTAALTPAPASSGGSSTKKKTTSTKSSYVRRNTGNGKTRNTGRHNKAVDNIDRPRNQHGIHSVKVKEAAVPKLLNDGIMLDGSNLKDTEDRVKIHLASAAKQAAKDGERKALQDLGFADFDTREVVGAENPLLSHFINNNLTEYFSDIKTSISNTRDRETLRERINRQSYRLDYLKDFVERKAYWNAYLKLCEREGIKKVIVMCDENSRHKHKHLTVINPHNYDLNDIPGFSANCHCRLEACIE